MIFITGATGFLGSHLLHDLVKSGQPVRALYRDSNKLAFVKRIFQYYQTDAGHLMDSIEWVQGDILDFKSMMDYMKGIDQVYHCAGIVSFQGSDKMKLMDINVIGTSNVVNACLELNIPRLCHVSSISALGISQDGELIDESRLWNQGTSASDYSVSKFRSEMEVWRGIHEGLNAVIVNPSVIIGPGMWHGSVSGLYQQIYRGLSYYPTGASGYVDVRDVVQTMIRLTNSALKGERYIISSENKTHREIINYLAEGIHRPFPTRRLSPFLMKVVSNMEKIRSLLTGKPLRITSASLKSATGIFSYSNRKIGETLSIDFIPIKESIEFSSRLLTDEMHNEHNVLTSR
jgi:dihydroflavonol-4-reductase